MRRKNPGMVLSIRFEGRVMIFPQLQQIAREFGKRNKLSRLEIIGFIHDGFEDARLEYIKDIGSTGISGRGLILSYKQGRVVLTTEECSIYHINGRTEPGYREDKGIYGEEQCFPVRTWRRGYFLAGRLNEKNTRLRAVVEYIIRYKEKFVTYEEIKDEVTGLVLVGNPERKIIREDRSPLWFLKWQDKK